MELAKELMAKAKEKGVKLLLPVDNVCGDSFSNDCHAHHRAFVKDDSRMTSRAWTLARKPQMIFADEIVKARHRGVERPDGRASSLTNFAVGTRAIAQAHGGVPRA